MGILKLLRGVASFAASYAVSYLMPPRCMGCNCFVFGSAGLCSTCWAKTTFIRDLCCLKCGRLARYQGMQCALCIKDPPEYDCARSLMDFNDLAKNLIHSFKYQDRLELAKFFSSLLWNAQRNFIMESDAIAFVPMHPLKMAFRFYNQAHLLAECISKLSNIPINRFGLKKFKLTKSQSAFGRKERMKNLKGSFVVPAKDAFEGRSVLLVDDVLTTGTTASTCAKALKEAGALRVCVLTVASVRL